MRAKLLFKCVAAVVICDLLGVVFLGWESIGMQSVLIFSFALAWSLEKEAS